MIKTGENIEIINNLPKNDMVSGKLLNWAVYKIISPNNRVYIGISSNIERRKSEYAKIKCKSQPVLYNSLIKYGFESHKFEVLEDFVSDYSYAGVIEKKWINEYKSNCIKYPDLRGLNVRDGANGGNNVGAAMKEDTKEKLRQANLGKKYSEETKAKVSLALKNRVQKERTQELKDKMRKIKLGTKHTEQAKKSMSLAQQNQKGKRVLQYTLEGEFINEYISLNLAARELGISAACIHRVVHGKREKTKGFIFKYKL